jgi:hypothetical protein
MLGSIEKSAIQVNCIPVIQGGNPAMPNVWSVVQKFHT